MKTTALFIIILTIFMLTTAEQDYRPQTEKEEKRVFAYNNESQPANIQMKPLSGDNKEYRRESNASLKLMTYNIHRGVGKDGKLDLNAVAQVIRASNADIIALQEVERYSIRTGFKDQIKYLSSKTEMNHAFGRSKNILNGEYGNGLLSKYPIEEFKVFVLPSAGEPRTVLRAVINLGGFKLAVYNTHLGLKASERKEQINYIIKLISQEKLAYILMGDMNAKEDQLKAFAAVAEDSAQLRGKQQLNTFEEKEVKGRIDYIFVQTDIAVSDYNIVISDASDHYPVVSDVRVNR